MNLMSLISQDFSLAKGLLKGCTCEPNANQKKFAYIKPIGFLPRNCRHDICRQKLQKNKLITIGLPQQQQRQTLQPQWPSVGAHIFPLA